MTHPKTDFLKYIGTPFERYILPIVPAAAKLKANSGLSEGHLGKIPGKFYPGLKEWSGFCAWQFPRARAADLQRWQGWQDDDQAAKSITLGLSTGPIIATDGDVSDEFVAEQVMKLIIMMLGPPGAIRRRPGTGRFVMFYGHKPHTAPVSKSRIGFDILATDEKAAVEVLGYGQQVVAEGPQRSEDRNPWRVSRRSISHLRLVGNRQSQRTRGGLHGWEVVVVAARPPQRDPRRHGNRAGASRGPFCRHRARRRRD